MNYRLDHKALFICSVNSCCIILIIVQLSSPQLSPIQLFFRLQSGIRSSSYTALSTVKLDEGILQISNIIVLRAEPDVQ